ncbi:hydantoinase B/oxoprolinase family protein [Chelatococcus sp.]|nr:MULTISPECIES: hydantoinase B/oxoprolinase family protein [unclassified Chelatococcus]
MKQSKSIPDGVTLWIQWSRLISIMDEVDIALVRTSFSTIVGETRDFAVILLDKHARSIAQSQLSSPAFTCSLPSATRRLLQDFPPETLRRGDVLITNDPWICHGHLPDFYIIVPLFGDDEIVGYIATAAHISDIGGRLDEFDARDVFEEGLRIPPSKLYVEGKPNRQLFDILRANIRYPTQVLGDVDAIVGAAHLGGARLTEFMQDYGEAGLDAAAEEILKRSEAAMRSAIRAIPDGTYKGATDCDGYKIPTHIAVSIEVSGDTVVCDFAGSSLQRHDASINSVMNVTHAHSLYAFKCALLPDIPNNEGLFRPIATRAEAGSILNASFPAPVKARSKTSYHIHNAIYGALAEALPHGVQAGSGSFWSVKCFGSNDDGSNFAMHVLPNGGRGAVNGADGQPTIAFPGNGTITPAEIIENIAPIVVLERSLRTDSGGPGEFRGGLGQTIRLTTLGRSVRMTIRPDKIRFPAPGLSGGHPGAAGALTRDGEVMPLEPFELQPTQVVTLDLPGGGGFGDPRQRASAAVQGDLAEGKISLDAATNVYGHSPQPPMSAAAE